MRGRTGIRETWRKEVGERGGRKGDRRKERKVGKKEKLEKKIKYEKIKYLFFPVN